jgi:hypothetical protein
MQESAVWHLLKRKPKVFFRLLTGYLLLYFPSDVLPSLSYLYLDFKAILGKYF